MTPQNADQAFLLCIISGFVALGVSLFARKPGLWLLRIVITGLAAIYSLSTIRQLLAAVGMANAFGPSQGGAELSLLCLSLLVAYYGFAVVTCFSPLPNRWLLFATHFVVAPVVACFSSLDSLPRALLATVCTACSALFSSGSGFTS
ncbi:MAG: hypothetical protein WCQ21_04805 [Verrucomicrobiota bacterium]|jgi:hypothetical protein